MKKPFLSIMALLTITSTVYSQNVVEKTLTTISNTVDTLQKGVSDGIAAVDTGSLYRTIYEDAKSGLAGLADALKVGVEHVYKVLVMQQVVKSIVWIIYLLLAIPLGIVLWKGGKKLVDYCDDGNPAFVMYCIFLGLGFVGFLIVGLCHLDVIVTGILNPEFGAMQQIMEWVNPPATHAHGCSTCK